MTLHWIAFCIDGWSLINEEGKEVGIVLLNESSKNWHGMIVGSDKEPVFKSITLAARWVEKFNTGITLRWICTHSTCSTMISDLRIFDKTHRVLDIINHGIINHHDRVSIEQLYIDAILGIFTENPSFKSHLQDCIYKAFEFATRNEIYQQTSQEDRDASLLNRIEGIYSLTEIGRLAAAMVTQLCLFSYSNETKEGLTKRVLDQWDTFDRDKYYGISN